MKVDINPKGALNANPAHNLSFRISNAERSKVLAAFLVTLTKVLGLIFISSFILNMPPAIKK
jgi:hypothetical protein